MVYLFIILIILAGKSFKPQRLTAFATYVFAGVAYEFRGGLWLNTFLSGLRRLTVVAWGLTEMTALSYPTWQVTLRISAG